MDTTAEAAVGRALVALRNTSFLLGPTLMSAINALLLGTLMYRARLVPRVIPVIGLVGAPLMVASVTAILFGAYNLGSTSHGLAAAPIFVWELSLGLWMTFKGFRKDAPLMVEAAAEDASLADSANVTRSSIGVAANAGAA